MIFEEVGFTVDRESMVNEIKKTIKRVHETLAAIAGANLPEKEFTENLLALWNIGLLRMTRLTDVVNLIDSRFGGDPSRAYSYLRGISQRERPTGVHEEELLLAALLQFHFLYKANPITFIFEDHIPADLRKTLLSLFMDIFHADSLPYNSAYKVVDPNPCPCEDNLVRTIRRLALNWVTMPVYMFDSRRGYYCVPTNLVLDIGRFPGPTSAREVGDAFPKILADIESARSGMPLLNPKMFAEVAKLNGLELEDKTLVGLPSYSKNGTPETIIYYQRPSPLSAKELIRTTHTMTLNDADDLALKFLFSLCTKGIFNMPDKSKHWYGSQVKTRRLDKILAPFSGIEIKKYREGYWYLYDSRTGKECPSLPLVLLFPMMEFRRPKQTK